MVARFKGDVPLPLLLVHVGVIFSAMLWSARAGLEALTRGPRLRRHVTAAAVLMFVGGLILGPFVQKAAFDAYWTGWPSGHDLTDNKVALAMLLWIVAWWRAARRRARCAGLDAGRVVRHAGDLRRAAQPVRIAVRLCRRRAAAGAAALIRRRGRQVSRDH